MKEKLLFAFLFIITFAFQGNAQWTQRASLSTARGQHGSIAHPNGKIYAFGGYNTAFGFEIASMEVYDPSTNGWSAGASLPVNTRGFAYALGNNNNIYLFGGFNGGHLSVVYRFDPNNNTWANTSTMPTGVWEASATTGTDGRIYVIGGENGPNLLQIYNPASNSWSMGASLPYGTVLHESILGNDGRIYVFGGSPLTTVQIYDPISNTWTLGAPMSVGKRQFGISKGSNGMIYIIGGKTSGMNQDGPFFNSVEVYNPGTNTWSAHSTLPISMGELSATKLNGKMYAIGGVNPGFLNNVYSFDLPNETVSSITTSVSGSSFCQGQDFIVNFTASGVYNNGNTFTAQLSDASGNFTSPVTIGAIAATTSGSINATIPTNASSGSGYRIRIIASNPAIVGSNNGSNITINALPTATITPGGPTTFCNGGNVSLTASGGNTYTWSTGSNSSSITADASGTYSVTVTGNGGCTSAATISVTEVAMPAPTVTSPVVTCAGKETTLNATAVSGGYLSWFANATGGTPIGSGTSLKLTPTIGASYFVQENIGGSNFTVNTLATTAGGAIEHGYYGSTNSYWDDRGTIAVTNSHVFVTGDGATIRTNHDLSGLVNLPIRDALFSDLGTGILWSFTTNNNPIQPAGQIFGNAAATSITGIVQVDENNLNASGSVINLSTPIPISYDVNGNWNAYLVAPGYNYVILARLNTTTFYKIDLPTGNVTELNGTLLQNWNNATTDGVFQAESWASYGWSEKIGNDFFLVYRDYQNSGTFLNRIVRRNITTGEKTVVQQFTNLSDMAAITYAPWLNRMYFHHEGTSQFKSGDETLGYVSGTSTLSTSGLSCESPRAEIVVTVTNPEVTLTPAGPIDICADGLVALTSSISESSGTATSYEWYKDNVLIPNATGTSYNVTEPGVYKVKFINTDNCTDFSNEVSVTKTTPPPAAIVADGPTTFCPAGSVTLTASTGDTYLWSNGETTKSIIVTTTGNYSVTVTTNDCSATSAPTTVTVQDNLAPVPDVENLSDAIGECSATVVAPKATDNCKGQLTATTSDPLTYTAQGTYYITWTFDDGNGNVTIQKQKVVVDDVTAPEFTAPANQPVLLNAAAPCQFQVPDLISNLNGTDNCNGAVTFKQVPAAGTWINASHNSTHSIVITADDGNGNTTDKTVVLTAKDETKPSFVAPLDRNVYLGNSCYYTVPDLLLGLSGTDNCGTVTFTQSPEAGTSLSGSHNGTYTVTITARDGNGNSLNKEVTLTALDDVLPMLTVPAALTVNCQDNTLPAATGSATATDNCTASPTISFSDVSTKDADATRAGHYNYTITRTWKAKDGAGNESTGTQFISVQDVTAPTVITKDIQVYLELDGTVSIAAAAVNNGSSDNCSPVTLHLSKTSFNTTNVGENIVTLTVTDVTGNSAGKTAKVVVMKRPTTLVYTGDGSEQYSDQQVLTAELRDQLSNTVLVSKTISFALGTQSTNGTTNASGVASQNLILTQSPIPTYAVTSNFGGDAIFEPSADSDPFDILQEDARAYYTGALFASTSSANSSNATITLSATIKDITAVTGDPAHDGFAGDIRNATVSFIDRDNNTVIATVPIGLVVTGDLLVGTATYNWATTIGNADSKQFTIGIRVNNYYTRNVGEENSIVTVSKPLSDFITGGGYINLTTSNGQKAGDAGTKNNFGFNVKYNKKGTNLQGTINTIFRRTEADGILHTYQIKGNAMTSLSVQPGTTTKPSNAIFNGKANMQDITNPLAAVSMGGNLTLQVTMADYGEPGSKDEIAITVWNNDGGMLYSSNWNGTKTVQQVLAGGNIKVSGGAYSSGGVVATTNDVPVAKSASTMELAADMLALTAMPNPSTTHFTLVLKSGNDQPANLRVLDGVGRAIEMKAGVAPNQTLRIGQNYRPGIYYVEVLQGSEKIIVKLVKTAH